MTDMQRRNEAHGTEYTWDGKNGIARHRGVFVPLRTAPKIGTIPLVREVDYYPSLARHSIRESGKVRREMRPEEIQEVVTLLETAVAAADQILNPDPAILAQQLKADPCIDRWVALAEATAGLPEHQAFVECLSHCGMAYPDITAMLRRIRDDNEAVVRLVSQALRKADAEQAPPITNFGDLGP